VSIVTVPPPSPSIAASLAAALPGDVILITPCDTVRPNPLHAVPLAKLIREATRAPVSHSLVVVQGGCFADIRASRRPALAQRPLSELIDMGELRGCWLLRHVRSAPEGDGALGKAIVESVAALLNAPVPAEFATAELVKGLLLLLARQDGPALVADLGLRDQLRRLVGGSADRMFCSEFTYRAFANAAAATGVPEYGIDCPDLLLGDWSELFHGPVGEREGPLTLTPTLTVEEGSPIDRLSSQGQLVGLPVRVTTVGVPDGRASDFRVDPAFDADAAGFLLRFGEMAASGSASGQIADFVTPRDLLHSPSLTPIARWGLGLGEELDPWRCPSSRDVGEPRRGARAAVSPGR